MKDKLVPKNMKSWNADKKGLAKAKKERKQRLKNGEFFNNKLKKHYVFPDAETLYHLGEEYFQECDENVDERGHSFPLPYTLEGLSMKIGLSINRLLRNLNETNENKVTKTHMRVCEYFKHKIIDQWNTKSLMNKYNANHAKFLQQNLFPEDYGVYQENNRGLNLTIEFHTTNPSKKIKDVIDIDE